MSADKKTKSVWDNMRPGPHIVTLSFGDAAKVCGFSRDYEANLIIHCTQGIARALVVSRDDIAPRDGQLQMTPQGQMVGVMLVQKLAPEQKEEWKRQRVAGGFIPK